MPLGAQMASPWPRPVQRSRGELKYSRATSIVSSASSGMAAFWKAALRESRESPVLTGVRMGLFLYHSTRARSA